MIKMNRPWDIPATPWKTQAAFEAWVRGQIRRGWARHPVKNLYIQRRRFKKDNGKGRLTWHVECEKCKDDFPQGKTQVDHLLASTIGGVKSEEGWGRLVTRMYYVTFDDIQILCKPCHDVKTYSERKNISFEKAVIEKQVVDIMKKNVHDLKIWLQHRHEPYLTPKPKNKDTVRRLLNDSID